MSQTMLTNHFKTRTHAVKYYSTYSNEPEIYVDAKLFHGDIVIGKPRTKDKLLIDSNGRYHKEIKND